MADNTKNKVGIGLKLPIQNGTRGYFDTTTENIEQAKYNLENLLETRKGERLMQPTLGTDLHLLLFEPNDDNLEITVEDEIEEAINLWLPYINIDQIIIDRSPEKIDNYQVGIEITFSLTNDPTTLATAYVTITQ